MVTQRGLNGSLLRLSERLTTRPTLNFKCVVLFEILISEVTAISAPWLGKDLSCVCVKNITQMNWPQEKTRFEKGGKALSKNCKACKLALQHWLETMIHSTTDGSRGSERHQRDNRADNARIGNVDIPAAVASCVEAVPLRFCSLNKSFAAGGVGEGISEASTTYVLKIMSMLKYPDVKVIRVGIGDTTEPIRKVIASAKAKKPSTTTEQAASS
ncbi:hypothetical protein Tco_0941858 [Tanacetum coccineum]|uniref:Uncharacterized protein n=1 Tax=Tanacetum coccineum TaxID=301880 RepID=A0ABQ5DSY8_9ASTR